MSTEPVTRPPYSELIADAVAAGTIIRRLPAGDALVRTSLGLAYVHAGSPAMPGAA